MVLSKQNQCFLQHMMAAGALSRSRTAKMFNACGDMAVEHCNMSSSVQIAPDGSGLDDAMDVVNSAIERFGLQLRSVHSPWEGDVFYGLVNTIEDPAAQLATQFSAAERAFFFATVEELLEEGGEMSLVEMQNAGPNYKLHVAEAGRTIQELHRAQWLRVNKLRNEGTRVSFGVRSLLELPNVRTWVLQNGCEVAPVASDRRRVRSAKREGGTPSSTQERSCGYEDDDDGDDFPRSQRQQTPVQKKRRTRRSSRGGRTVTSDEDD